MLKQFFLLQFVTTAFLILLCKPLGAVQTLSFGQLAEGQDCSQWHQQQVEIKGFLYAHMGTKHWILSSEPNLKTCCIASTKKVAEQIFIFGDFENIPNGRAVAIQGTFLIDPRKNTQGELVQLYRLQDATLVSSQNSPWPIWTLMFTGLCLAGIFLSRRR